MTTPIDKWAEEIWNNLADRAGSGLDSWDSEIKKECKEGIAKTLEEYAERERAEGFLEGCSKESQRAIAKLAFNQGAAQMKERAIQACDCIECIVAVRKIPLTPGETELPRKPFFGPQDAS